MGLGHHHLTGAAAQLDPQPGHQMPHRRLTQPHTLLIDQPLPDPPGRVPLLPRRLPIRHQPTPNKINNRPGDRRGPLRNWGVSFPPDSDLRWEICSQERKVIMGKYRTFTPEYRQEAVKMVTETDRSIAAVARDLGINEGTLGNWVNKYRHEHPASEELNVSDRARLKELENENRELRMERDFLKKAAAFFAKEQ